MITIAQAEFPGNSEKSVRIGVEQLYDRCQEGGLYIVLPNTDGSRGRQWRTAGELLDAIYLDNNGNGFVLLVGVDSCAEGTSLIEADLESSPFTTETGTFTVEAPRPRFGS